MEIQINIWAVLLATVASMVVGSVWYARSVFGKMWAKWVGLSDKQLQEGGWTPILIAIVVSFITAYALAHFAYISNAFFGNSFMQDTLVAAFWVWLGFTAARFITHDSFEHRPLKLTALNIVHELVTIMAMAVIIGWLRP